MKRISEETWRRSLAWLSVMPMILLLFIGRIPFAASSESLPLLVHTGRELMRSLDGGKQWQVVRTPFGGSRIYRVIADPSNAALWAATEVGLYLSQDDGQRWQRRPTSQTSQGQAVFAVAVARDRLLVGTVDGLLVSRDAGVTWQKVVSGFPDAALPLAIEVAPSDANVIYVGTERHGIFRSEDGGASWLAVSHGLPEAVGAAPVTPVQNVVIHPTNPNVAYAVTEVNGIYKTTDGGFKWQAVNNGLPGWAPYRTYHPLLAIDQQRPETVYAVIGYPVHSHKIDNKVYRSTNGGARWHAIGQLPPNVAIATLSVNPIHRDELLIGYGGDVLRVEATAEPLWERERWAMIQDAAAKVLDADVGEITVLEDADGTLAHLFNLHGRTLEFTLTRNRYLLTVRELSLETDLGTKLAQRNDDSTPVPLPFSFSFFGVAFDRINVGSNGNITLGTYRDRVSRATTALFAAQPRIAPLWDDYDPSRAPDDGGVFVRVDPQQVVVTWSKVPEVFQTNSNTFQVVISSDGTIRMNYADVNNPVGGLIGLSPGGDDSVFAARFNNESGRRYPARPFAEMFDGEFDLVAIARRFYQSHPDTFDFLAMWGGSSLLNTAGEAFAFYRPVRNDAAGIGIPVGEFGGGPSFFGSAGRLQGVLNMNSLRLYPAEPTEAGGLALDVLGEETGHRWGAFVRFRDGKRDSSELLGRMQAHWSFFLDSDASQLEGNDWRDNGDGTFTTVGIHERYSPLDQYLMGLRPPAEVPAFFLIRNSPRQMECFGEGPQSCPPELNVTTSGTRVDISVDQVVQAEGPRVPAAGDAPATFRQAFILVVPAGQADVMADVEKLERIRQAWEAYFPQATDGRGTIITRLGNP